MDKKYKNIIENAKENDVIKALEELSFIEEKWADSLIIKSLTIENKGIRSFAQDILIDKSSEYIAENLIGYLSSESIEIRNIASKILIKIGEISLGSLYKALKHKSHDVRKFVVDIIGKINKANDDILNRFMDMLFNQHENINVKFSICNVLAKVGKKENIDQLKKIDDDPNIGYMALFAIGSLGKEKELDYLKLKLNTDDLLKKFAIVDVLGKLNNPKILDFLYERLEKEEGFLNFVICKAIANNMNKNCKIKSGLENFKTAIKLDDCDIKKDVSKAFYYDGREYIIKELIPLLDDKCREVSEKVLKYFINIDKYIIKDCDRLYNNFSKQGKINILYLIGEKNIIEKQNFLLQEIDSKKPDIRKEAATAVAKLTDVKNINKLRETAKKEEDLEVLSEMIRALGWHKDTKSISLLIDFLKEYKEEELVQNIVGALVLMGNQKVIAELENLLKEDISDELKRSIIYILGWIGEEEIIEVIYQYLNDDDPDIRERVIYILGRLQAYKCLDNICFFINDEAEKVREAALYTLYKLDHKDILDYIKKMTYDDAGWLRYNAYKLLAKYLPDEDIKQFLIKRFYESENIDKISIIQNLAEANYDKNIEKLFDKILNNGNRDLKIEVIDVIKDNELKSFINELKNIKKQIDDIFIIKKIEDTLRQLGEK